MAKDPSAAVAIVLEGGAIICGAPLLTGTARPYTILAPEMATPATPVTVPLMEAVPVWVGKLLAKAIAPLVIAVRTTDALQTRFHILHNSPQCAIERQKPDQWNP